ncbi:hypothetical protein [Marivirga arenosa]|uniref:Uncharacterized protein n=1 Tax=Marivirga arenosa TaxID=3059076 RepID=A0AA51R7T1_9BACT|nr:MULTISPECIES: hypothetical protein [unclassified Marivirga]WMN07942.1 hypothetical protein QYS48_30445 [Marivirga sp. ABR2-2]WNB17849.1 hypothetical protein QYS47_28340 [Marivirga sp. BKB1-2]
MEAHELSKIMEAYDNKLDKTLRLNKSSMDHLQLEKPQNKTKKILVSRISEVVVFSSLAIFLGWYVANNLGQTHLVISGIILHVFTLIALIGSIGQLVLLQQIDFSKPVIEIRKKIELVNSHGLLFLKLIFLSAPVWWSYAIVGLDVFLGFDIYIHLEQDFVIRYLVINFLLIIPLLWFLNKLSYKNLHIKWVRNTIKIFTDPKTKKALEFLNDVEEFEN